MIKTRNKILAIFLGFVMSLCLAMGLTLFNSQIETASAEATPVTPTIYWTITGDHLYIGANQNNVKTASSSTSTYSFSSNYSYTPWRASSYPSSIASCTIVDKIVLSNAKEFFRDMYKLTAIENIENIDVSNATNFSLMFYGCTALKGLNVSNFDVSNGTDFSFMFGNCKLVPELDVSNFDVSNGTNFCQMFASCDSVTELDVSNWNMSKAGNLSYMFYGCTLVDELDFSKWNAKPTDVTGMLSTCGCLRKVDMSGIDMSSCKDGRIFFDDTTNGSCLTYNLKTIISPINVKTSNKVYLPDYNYQTNISKDIANRNILWYDLSDDNTSVNYLPLGDSKSHELCVRTDKDPMLNARITPKIYWGIARNSDTSLDCTLYLSNNPTDLSGYCNVQGTQAKANSFVAMDLDTSIAATSCKNQIPWAENIPINAWSSQASTKTWVKKVVILNDIVPSNTNFWFGGLHYQQSGTYYSNNYIDEFVGLENIDMSNVYCASAMFKDACGSSIKGLEGMANWDMSGVNYMNRMFDASSAVGSIENWDVTNLRKTRYMFLAAKNATIDVSKWQPINLEYAGFMFSACKCSYIDTSNWYSPKLTNAFEMFYNSQVVEIDLSNIGAVGCDLSGIAAKCSSLKTLNLSGFISPSYVGDICYETPSLKLIYTPVNSPAYTLPVDGWFDETDSQSVGKAMPVGKPTTHKLVLNGSANHMVLDGIRIAITNDNKFNLTASVTLPTEQTLTSIVAIPKVDGVYAEDKKQTFTANTFTLTEKAFYKLIFTSNTGYEVIAYANLNVINTKIGVNIDALKAKIYQSKALLDKVVVGEHKDDYLRSAKSLEEKVYSSASAISAFNTAISNAETVLNKEDVSQIEIDKTLDALDAKFYEFITTIRFTALFLTNGNELYVRTFAIDGLTINVTAEIPVGKGIYTSYGLFIKDNPYSVAKPVGKYTLDDGVYTVFVNMTVNGVETKYSEDVMVAVNCSEKAALKATLEAQFEKYKENMTPEQLAEFNKILLSLSEGGTGGGAPIDLYTFRECLDHSRALLNALNGEYVNLKPLHAWVDSTLQYRINIETQNASSVRVVYKEGNEIRSSRYITLKYKDNGEQYGYYDATRVGTYEVIVTYLDRETDSTTVTVSECLQAFEFSENDDDIILTKNEGFEIIRMYYIFGTKVDELDDFLTLNKNAVTAKKMGKGIHTFYVQAKFDGSVEYYYYTYDVQNHSGPSVVALGGAVGVYHYDLGADEDVKFIAYKVGTYTSFEEMRENAVYVPVGNILLDRNSFISGQTYTFCFATETQDYFVTLTI